jgi:HSP20 family protein
MSLFREFNTMFNEMDRISNELWNDAWVNSPWKQLNNNNNKDDQKQIQQQLKGDNNNNTILTNPDNNTTTNNNNEAKPKEEGKDESRLETKLSNEKNKGLLSSLWRGWDVNKSISLKVNEENDKYIVTATIPDFNKEQLKLQIKDGLLSISGEVLEEHKDEHSYSKSTKYVSRSMKLPNNINEENVSAKYENGILSVNIPKLDKIKEKKDTIMIE